MPPENSRNFPRITSFAMIGLISTPSTCDAPNTSAEARSRPPPGPMTSALNPAGAGGWGLAGWSWTAARGWGRGGPGARLIEAGGWGAGAGRWLPVACPRLLPAGPESRAPGPDDLIGQRRELVLQKPGVRQIRFDVEDRRRRGGVDVHEPRVRQG